MRRAYASCRGWSSWQTPALADLNARRADLDAAGRKRAAALLARPTDGNADPQNEGYTGAVACNGAGSGSGARRRY